MNHDDNSIPLLTEVIPMAPPPQVPVGHQISAAPDAASPVAEQYRQWQQEISENVLQHLLEQADSVLQQHLQDQMAVALDNISDILTQRVKESLRQALTETVTRAVAEEMARFASSKN